MALTPGAMESPTSSSEGRPQTPSSWVTWSSPTPAVCEEDLASAVATREASISALGELSRPRAAAAAGICGGGETSAILLSSVTFVESLPAQRRMRKSACRPPGAACEGCWSWMRTNVPLLLLAVVVVVLERDKVGGVEAAVTTTLFAKDSLRRREIGKDICLPALAWRWAVSRANEAVWMFSQSAPTSSLGVLERWLDSCFCSASPGKE